MESLGNSTFDELFKISIYRDITEQLFDRQLITNAEHGKIVSRIDAMEDDLVKPKVQTTRQSCKAKEI